MPRRTSPALLAGTAVVAIAALTGAGCGGGSDNGNANTGVTVPKTSSGRTATIGLDNAGGLGMILVDNTGRTLYLFEKDRGDRSSCTGSCAAAWPPLRDRSKPLVGTGADSALVGTTRRSDGAPQVTYNGHPLYRFGGDSGPGQTNGQGVNAFGAQWFALSAKGATVTATPSNGGGGRVY